MKDLVQIFLFYILDVYKRQYLYKADSKVLIHNSGNHQRKFIAIKVLINGYKHFVPLSSPDKRDYYNDQDGHKKVQFTRVPTIKMCIRDRSFS